ncbi:MAG: acyl-CoA dehydrogenase family protein [Acidimicrobiia bacterium]
MGQHHEPQSLTSFLAGARTFLDANVPRRMDDGGDGSGGGGDRVDLHGLAARTPAEEEREVAEARAWQAARADAGLGWISGPATYGGAGLPMTYEWAYRDLEAGYTVPDRTPLIVGLNMVAPTLAVHGTDEVRHRYLPPLHRGDVIACQLFSEPGAGSDLAAVRTRAVRDGDGWILEGQKVWTSKARFADIGECVARTDESGPPQHGITVFLVDMRAPGVEIRPLRQISGYASFNEVFLDGVRVPDDHRLGTVDDGWSVVRTTLMSERAGVGGGAMSPARRVLERLVALAGASGRADDPIIRQRLADAYARVRVNEWSGHRAGDATRAGGPAGPEGSVGKLAHVENLRRMDALVTELLGPRLTADTGEADAYAWAEYVLSVPGIRLGGGTDEIQRNVLGEQVLGLPREPRGDAWAK